MTANELRDLADDLEGEFYDAIQKAVAYLRACADAAEKGPVAWMWEETAVRSSTGIGGTDRKLLFCRPVEEPWKRNITPLYPVAMPSQPSSNPCQLPEPPHECKTEDEKRAFAFGWWKAMEARKPEEVKMPEPMTENEFKPYVHQAAGRIGWTSTRAESDEGYGLRMLARAIEAETLRRVREANK